MRKWWRARLRETAADAWDCLSEVVPDEADSGLTKADLTPDACRKWIDRVTSDVLKLEGNGGMEYQKGRMCFSSFFSVSFYFLFLIHFVLFRLFRGLPVSLYRQRSA
jgi:hypothetical protein